MARICYFAPIDPGLPEAEQAARAKRQRHAKWGVAGLAGAFPTPELVVELQAYVDGYRGLAELPQAAPPAG
ncbi:MAG TPA: hypothetical protein VF690_11005 [Hymenobacter sp.]|jgi:hypothetical protein